MSKVITNIEIPLEPYKDTVESKFKIVLTEVENNKVLQLKCNDCFEHITLYIPLSIRGIKKIERIKTAIDLLEKELHNNIEYGK